MQIEAIAADGHRFEVRWHPACARGTTLLFLPALAVRADRYDRFAQALATQGVSVAVPDWRGLASSSLRPRRGVDWGYPQLLGLDLPAVRAALAAQRYELLAAGWVPAGIGRQWYAHRFAWTGDGDPPQPGDDDRDAAA
jgi:predicted alpha/beta hydrolase